MTRFVRVLIVASFIACAATPLHAQPTAPLAKTSTLRIMALGDSITAGVGPHGAPQEDGGYRGELATLLASHGYHAVFVGSRADYSERIVERAHEGWPGYVLRSFPSDPGPGQLYGPLVQAALRRNAPDIVLLMAGTNDLLRSTQGDAGYTVPNILDSLSLVIEQIVTERPGALVLVAPVVRSPKIDACTLARFDGIATCDGPGGASLRTVVARFAERGANVALAAGMDDAVPADLEHFPDGIHPSGAGGYRAIAGVWFATIDRLAQASSSDVAADGAVR